MNEPVGRIHIQTVNTEAIQPHRIICCIETRRKKKAKQQEQQIQKPATHSLIERNKSLSEEVHMCSLVVLAFALWESGIMRWNAQIWAFTKVSGFLFCDHEGLSTLSGFRIFSQNRPRGNSAFVSWVCLSYHTFGTPPCRGGPCCLLLPSSAFQCVTWRHSHRARNQGADFLSSVRHAVNLVCSSNSAHTWQHLPSKQLPSSPHVPLHS